MKRVLVLEKSTAEYKTIFDNEDFPNIEFCHRFDFRKCQASAQYHLFLSR